MIQLVLKRSGTSIDVVGVDGKPLFTIPLLEPARGAVVPLHGRGAGAPLPPGHYRVVAWAHADGRRPAHLELADLELGTEARLIDAGIARRASAAHLLDVGGIGAPTGGLRGRRGAIVAAGSAEAVRAGGGLLAARAELLRLIDLLEGDPSRGTVVLTVAGEPYFAN